jgi:hypothetical protein
MLRQAHLGRKGGEPPFAAVCTKVSYAQIVTFAKFQLFSDSGLSCRVRRKLAVSPYFLNMQAQHVGLGRSASNGRPSRGACLTFLKFFESTLNAVEKWCDFIESYQRAALPVVLFDFQVYNINHDTHDTAHVRSL